MDKVVLFNRPIWLVKDIENGVRNPMEVYGFKLTQYKGEDAIEDYLDYLCGVAKWEQEGNTYEYGCWIPKDFNDRTYCEHSSNIRRFIRRARQQSFLTYMVFGTNKILDKNTEGMWGGDFIISRDLYNNIMEYGVIVDVQNDDLNISKKGVCKD